MICYYNPTRRITCLLLIFLSTNLYASASYSSSAVETERVRVPSLRRTRQQYKPDVESSRNRIDSSTKTNVFRASCSKRVSTGTNGDLSAYGQMFNVRRPNNANSINYLSIISFEIYTDIFDPAMNVTYELYSREGDYQTAKSDMRFWTLVASGTLEGGGAGKDRPTRIPQVLDLPVSSDDGRAFYITLKTKDLIYSKGRGTQGDARVQQANQDLEIWEGVGLLTYPAQQSFVIGPRSFLGALGYKSSPNCNDDIFDNNGNSNTDGSGTSSKVKLSFFSEHSNRFSLDKIVSGINDNAQIALQEIFMVDEKLQSYALRTDLKISKVESEFVPLDEKAPRCIPSGSKKISETICSVVNTIVTFSHAAMSENEIKTLRESVLSHGDNVVNKIGDDNDFDNTQYIGVQIKNDSVEIDLFGPSREMNAEEQEVFQQGFIRVFNPILEATEQIHISKATVIDQKFSTASRRRERRRRAAADFSSLSSNPTTEVQSPSSNRSLNEDGDSVGRNTITLAFVAESRPSDTSLKLTVTKALLNYETVFLQWLKLSPEKEYFQFSYMSNPMGADHYDTDDETSNDSDDDTNANTSDDDSDDKVNVGAIVAALGSLIGIGVIGIVAFSCCGISCICWQSKKREEAIKKRQEEEEREQQRVQNRRSGLRHFANRVSSRVLAHYPVRPNSGRDGNKQEDSRDRRGGFKQFANRVSSRVLGYYPAKQSGGGSTSTKTKDSADRHGGDLSSSKYRGDEQNTASSTDTGSKDANNPRKSSDSNYRSHDGFKKQVEEDVMKALAEDGHKPSMNLDDYMDTEMNRSEHRGANNRRGIMDVSTSSRGDGHRMSNRSEHNKRRPSMDVSSSRTDPMNRSDHDRPSQHARRATMDMSSSSGRQRHNMKRPSMDMASNRTDPTTSLNQSDHYYQEDFTDTSPGRQRHSSGHHDRDRLNKSEHQARRSTMDNSFSYLDHEPMTSSRSEHRRRQRPSMDLSESDRMNRSAHNPRHRRSKDLGVVLDKHDHDEMKRSGHRRSARRETTGDMVSEASSSRKEREEALAQSLDKADRERLNKSEHNHRRRPSMDMNSSGHQRHSTAMTSRSEHRRTTTSMDIVDRDRMNKSGHQHRSRSSRTPGEDTMRRSTRSEHRRQVSEDLVERDRMNQSERQPRRGTMDTSNTSGRRGGGRTSTESRSEHRRTTKATSLDIVDRDRMNQSERQPRRGTMDTSNTSGRRGGGRPSMESRSEHRRTAPSTSLDIVDRDRMNQSERQPRRGTMDLSTSSRNRRRHG